MHIHYSMTHGDPHADGRPVDSAVRGDLVDAHPQMETVPNGVVDMAYDDSVSADHFRLYRWYESHDRERLQEYRIATYRDASSLQGGWLPVPVQYVDELLDMLVEVQLDHA